MEQVETVDEAVESFYYPPLGRRSFGGRARKSVDQYADPLEYAQWWNENGILGFKVESLQSVLNIRTLVKPGITYIDFGPADLMFDIESHDHPTFKSVDDCREFMQQELEGIDVRFS